MLEPVNIPKIDKGLPQISFGIRYSNAETADNTKQPDPLHIHNYLEIFFNFSSGVTFLVNNELFSVPRGAAIVSRPGEPHIGLIDRATPFEFFCLWIDSDFSFDAFSFLYKEDFYPLFSFDSDVMRMLYTMLTSLTNDSKKGSSNLQKTSLILQILSIFETKKFTNRERLMIPRSLEEILDDIQKNFATIRNVSSILETHYISSTTLNRWFRQYIHSSPREYLESVRLSNAMNMLIEGSTVTEACINCGFSDCSHFIILFKKKFGLTPKQYIKNLNANT